jgi:hypothetical protein
MLMYSHGIKGSWSVVQLENMTLTHKDYHLVTLPLTSCHFEKRLN